MGDVALVLIIILILVIIWRGPKTMPQIGNMLGRGVKATREEAKAIREDVSPTTPKRTATTARRRPPDRDPHLPPRRTPADRPPTSRAR